VSFWDGIFGVLEANQTTALHALLRDSEKHSMLSFTITAGKAWHGGDVGTDDQQNHIADFAAFAREQQNPGWREYFPADLYDESGRAAQFREAVCWACAGGRFRFDESGRLGLAPMAAEREIGCVASRVGMCRLFCVRRTTISSSWVSAMCMIIWVVLSVTGWPRLNEGLRSVDVWSETCNGVFISNCCETTPYCSVHHHKTPQQLLWNTTCRYTLPISHQRAISRSSRCTSTDSTTSQSIFNSSNPFVR
jgi:hypothetical protein